MGDDGRARYTVALLCSAVVDAITAHLDAHAARARRTLLVPHAARRAVPSDVGAVLSLLVRHVTLLMSHAHAQPQTPRRNPPRRAPDDPALPTLPALASLEGCTVTALISGSWSRRLLAG
ncbi:hypothetical protein B0H15DRAFT_947900 [Mycena belliarum]|uniref:Uncharacterized protein n=1 Tax=Mycena belliarum TaxID=1033014 RepID=A0AAD6XTU3_9AGAR|nr:hypothetical protein B0H15DRAFT_947900 [Mycena belliae]